MVPGEMVFMRCNADHHRVALVGGMESESKGAEMHHLAFEVETLDEAIVNPPPGQVPVLRDPLLLETKPRND